MNFKPIFILLVIVSLILQLKNCDYGAEHQDVPEKYKKAHLTAVSAQNLLKKKKYAEALKYYDAARRELEHPKVRGDKGDDLYINYGFVMNDIGVIHLSWALYGKDEEKCPDHIDIAKIDRKELALATSALEKAVAFYKRWYKHNPKEYERYSKALTETYANLGVAYKYAERKKDAIEMFRLALLLKPDNGNAERSLKMLDISPAPFIEAGEKELEKH